VERTGQAMLGDAIPETWDRMVRLYRARDARSREPLFQDVQHVSVDPEMVKLATQLIERQTGQYDPADLEDRYETRLRAMIDAKVQGKGLISPTEPVHSESNVIDLMAALRKSLGGAGETGQRSRRKEAGGQGDRKAGKGIHA